MCLVQKEVLNVLYTYVVLLALDFHNPGNKRYFLHIYLSITQAIVRKLGMHNVQHKKVPSAYTILFADVPLFFPSFSFENLFPKQVI